MSFFINCLYDSGVRNTCISSLHTQGNALFFAYPYLPLLITYFVCQYYVGYRLLSEIWEKIVCQYSDDQSPEVEKNRANSRNDTSDNGQCST
jgi:hypothetical protein